MKTITSQTHQTTHRPDVTASTLFGLGANECVTAYNALSLPEAVARKCLKKKED